MASGEFSTQHKKILFLLFGAIGDVTRALPLLTRVRRYHPEAYIAWAVEPAAAALLNSHPALDELFLFERQNGISAFLSFLKKVRNSNFDLVLDLQRHAKSGLVSFCSRAPDRLGFHRTNTKEANWLYSTRTIKPVREFSLKLNQYLFFADALGLPDDGIDFGLQLEHHEQLKIDRSLRGISKPFVTFYLGSSWQSRNWFPSLTANVAKTLSERYGTSAILLGTQDERCFAEKVYSELRNVETINLTGKTDLRELIGILSRSALAIGPDSGPMHIAAAVGTPVISLWGATSPIRSAPWGSEQLAIAGTAACSPCYSRNCPIERACMKRITVEQVVNKAEDILETITTR